MTLTERVNLAEPIESIVTMEAAAQNRLLDALAVAMERPTEALGCAYLLGYSVECTLKAALGRILGLALAQPVYPALKNAVGPQGLHDPNALLEACLLGRRVRSTPLSALDEGVWRTRVASIRLASAVGFRYKSVPLLLTELEPMLRDVEWIIAYAEGLWT